MFTVITSVTFICHCITFICHCLMDCADQCHYICYYVNDDDNDVTLKDINCNYNLNNVIAYYVHR